MMQDLDVNIEDMMLFYHVVDKGGFSKAAEALHICQTKVSRRIARLEESFDTPLLHRNMRDIALTETGKIVFEAAKDVLKRMNRACVDIQSQHQALHGRITVSMPTGFGNFWLSHIFREFLLQHPLIQMTFKNNDLGDANVMLGESDITIASSRPHFRESIACEFLCSYPFHIYASEEYLKRRGAPESLQDLDHHDIISVNEPIPLHLPHTLFTALLHAGRLPQNPRRPRIFIEDDLSLVICVAQGLGLAYMPHFFGDMFPGITQVVLKDQELLSLERKTHEKYLIYPKFLKKSLKHKTLIDFIKKKSKEFFTNPRLHPTDPLVQKELCRTVFSKTEFISFSLALKGASI